MAAKPVTELLRAVEFGLTWRKLDGQSITAIQERPNGFDLQLEDGRLLQLRVTCKPAPRKRKKKTEPKMIRASGDVVCDDCGKKYYDHPEDKGQLSFDGRPFLHIRCDGMRLKL